jgi:uncharacterized repeat protein (TIGR01451 family)
MRLRVMKYGLMAVGVALLIIAGASAGTSPTAAAPLAAITSTEPPTLTPVVATSTATPARPPTRTPRPKTGFADPAITKAVNVSEARIGDEVVFTIIATNLGTITADDVFVTDPIPDYLDVIEATTTRGDVSSSGRTVFINIGHIAPGEEIRIRIRARVNERAQPPGGRNSVSITTSSPGDNPANNSSEVTFAIVAAGTPTATLGPTATATATPVTPITLPPTGAAEQASNRISLVALLGLIALGLSLAIRGKARG